MDNQNGYYGTRQPEDSSSEYNAMLFVVRQALANCNHVALVQVQAVTSAGELAPAGRVDVLPLVNQLDGQGNAVPHGLLNDLVYLRLQGGANAVIMDPAVGDIGIAVFADRDISAVTATSAQANPGSARQFSMSDGIYLGGVLSSTPEQFVRFSDEGIEIVSPTQVRLAAPDVRIEAERIVMDATESIVMTAPEVSIDCETMAVNASTSATFTTPQFNVVGAANVSGLTSLNGGFAALPRSGGGASTITGNVNLTGDLGVTGDATTTGALTNNGKNVGSAHTHSGVQPGGDNTGGVN
jgi:hypothetical protein